MELSIFYNSDRNIMCNVLFTIDFSSGNGYLSYFYQTNIYYGSKLDILFLVFAIWSLWVAIHYYGYILFPEYSKLDINIIPKVRKKWILLYICTIIIGFFMIWIYRPILVYVMNVIIGHI